MRRPPDCYRLLGVGRGAARRQIREAYLRQMRRFHPDLRPGDPEAEEYARRLNLAYETLSDPDRRAEYDRTLYPAPRLVRWMPGHGSLARIRKRHVVSLFSIAACAVAFSALWRHQTQPSGFVAEFPLVASGPALPSADDPLYELGVGLASLQMALGQVESLSGGVAATGAVSVETLAAECASRSTRLSNLSAKLKLAREDVRNAASRVGEGALLVTLDLEDELLAPLRRAERSSDWLSRYYYLCAEPELAYDLYDLLTMVRDTGASPLVRASASEEFDRLARTEEVTQRLDTLLAAQLQVTTLSRRLRDANGAQQ